MVIEKMKELKELEGSKMKIKTTIGLIIIVISILNYVDLYQDGNNINTENAIASPLMVTTESKDLTIDVTKNSSAIGPYSTIEFSVEKALQTNQKWLNKESST